MKKKYTMGERIGQARRSRKLSQRQLAALIHVEPNTISMYESNARRPSTDVLERLSRILHVSTDYILMGRDSRYIDVSGLEDREAELLYELAEIMREKNKRAAGK